MAIAIANAYNLSVVVMQVTGYPLVARMGDHLQTHFLGFFPRGHYCYLKVTDIKPMDTEV